MNEKPTPPGEYDCCESGCDPCVWDIYRDDLRRWEAEQKKMAEADAASDAERANADAKD